MSGRGHAASLILAQRAGAQRRGGRTQAWGPHRQMRGARRGAGAFAKVWLLGLAGMGGVKQGSWMRARVLALRGNVHRGVAAKAIMSWYCLGND